MGLVCKQWNNENTAGWYSIKKVLVFVKFTGTWGSELVSPIKTYKISENTLYFGGVFRFQSNIYDGSFCVKSLRIKNVYQFRKNVLSYIFDNDLNTPLHLKPRITVGTFLQIQILQVTYYKNLSRIMF